MTIGSLFSGIGGLELGLERAGHGPVLWQVEKDAACRSVLAYHWPKTERFNDVCAVGRRELAKVRIICGGFPCQGVSDASHGACDGLDDPRSALWREFRRIVYELCPEWVIVENVDGAARYRWVPIVRSDLWDVGYSSVPIRVRASDLGAPHAGSRIFIAATYRKSESARTLDEKVALLPELATDLRKDWGQPSSEALGVVDGLSGRVDRVRLRQLGNAVVPQCAELVARIIPRSVSGSRRQP